MTAGRDDVTRVEDTVASSERGPSILAEVPVSVCYQTDSHVASVTPFRER